MKANYSLWTELPYAGETKPPNNPEAPLAGSWKLFFLKRKKGSFFTPKNEPIRLEITNPNRVDWNKQLEIVQETLNNVTPYQIQQAKYWGTGVATKQWTPIIDRLIDTYGVSAPRAARILAALQSGVNDAYVVAWYLKFK